MAKRMRGDQGIVRTVSAPMSQKKTYPRFAKSKVKSKIPLQLKSFIRKTIENTREQKVIVAAAVVNVNVAVANTPVGVNLVPRISQGTAVNQRIGNEIKCSSVYIRGSINVLPYNATTNPVSAPIAVKIWICRYKSVNTQSLLQTNIDTAFFENNAGSTSFSGNLTDMVLYPNLDAWEVLQSKQFKVGVGSNTTTTFPVGNVQAFDNSSFMVPFYFNVTRHLTGSIQYQDNSSDVSTNKNLFFVIQPVYAFTTSPSTAHIPIALNYAYRAEYTDA